MSFTSILRGRFPRKSRVPITCALCLLAAFGFSCHQEETRESAAPAPRDANVLLITLDTTRADHLSCYATSLPAGDKFHGAKTPRLDALAARGARFAHATAQVPLTLPSHASIMTGTYPPVHGLRDMGGFVLAKNHPTIATIAQAAGFETAAFVGSRVLSRHFGISNGFATYDDDMRGQTEEAMPGVYPERRASVVTDHALEWLKHNGGRKFFLWAHYYDPHEPYNPPEPFKRAYAQDLYSGEIAYMDEQVGRLLDGAEKMGLGGKTLIVVIGDHGESLGEHGEMTHGVFLYESTTHVPLLIAGPGVPSGKVIPEQVRSIDILPTILAFLNLPAGPEAQGVSLWPLIDQNQKVRSNYSYSETIYPRTYMGWSELRAMRTDEWKLIVAPHPELYNLARDPQETTNLIAKNPADADQLQKKIWEAAGTGPQGETIKSSPVDTQTRQELESLGYVSAGTPREIRLGTDAPDPKDRVNILKFQDQAQRLLNARTYPRAAQLMEQALKLDPQNPTSHLFLARAYEKLGNFEGAVRVYQHAIENKVVTDEIYSRLGKDELRLRHLDQAVNAMVQANQMNPTDLDNLRNLGTAYLQLNRVDDAERAFKAITVQNDKYSAAYNGLGLVAVDRNDAEGARVNFEKAIETGPDEVEPLLNLGVLYQKAGNKQQAVRYLQLFLQKAPRADYGELIPKVREAIRDLQRPS